MRWLAKWVIWATTIAATLVFATGCRDEPHVEKPGTSALSSSAGGAKTKTSDTIYESVVDFEEAAGDFERQLTKFAAELRRGNVEGAVEENFSKRARSTGFPSAPSGPVRESDWLYKRSWKIGEPAKHSNQNFSESFSSFLENFSEIEEIRFKLPEAQLTPDGNELKGALKFQLVGRNLELQREWVRGRILFRAKRENGERFRIQHFDAEGIESLLSSRELFNEVGGEAGIGIHGEKKLRFDRAGVHLTPLGVAAKDLDGDGLIDLFVPGRQKNYLYMNQGNGTFRDVASAAGLESLKQGQARISAPLFLDYDNDGDQDLFLSLNSLLPQVLFENRLVPDGSLFFTDVSVQSGIDRRANGYSATAGDVNRDGLPDIYVTSYAETQRGRGARRPVGLTRREGPGIGAANLLFLNHGDGTFSEQAGIWGISDGLRMSLAAQFSDIDMDGDLDLAVTNDYGGGSRLYLNDEGQRFSPSNESRGFIDPGYGMGIRVGDYDNDGDLDVHITNMSSTAGHRLLNHISDSDGPPPAWLERALFQAGGNTLLENLGDGRFQPASAEAGPFEAGWAWGGGFIDFDNDGWLDLHAPNGLLSGPGVGDT